MPEYAELHCHSAYSFQEGASLPHELLLRARELGYRALALTDHDNLVGAMEFAHGAKVAEVQAIIGAEVTLRGGHHLTLLAANEQGYHHLCRLLSYAHVQSPRRSPALDPALLPEHASGLVALSAIIREVHIYGQSLPVGADQPGVAQHSGLGTQLIQQAEQVARRYREWFGPNYYLELQHNLVYGDDGRIRGLLELSRKLDIPVVATNNAHYHVRSHHRLQDALVSIHACKSLEESHIERRPNSEFYLKSPAEMAQLFHECPEALRNTLVLAERCQFDLTRDLGYRMPDYPVPEGFDAQSYLEHVCYEGAKRKYGRVTERVHARLEEEFQLIRRHNLAGFFLLYYELVQLAHQVMVDLGRCPQGSRIEEYPPGRGRGSSVAMLVGYLIGLSHIDPLHYNLSLERFLPSDALTTAPDIDIDFPRDIREELIRRVHERWGWDHAALTGMVSTYQIRGAVRDIGKALALPDQEVDALAKSVEGMSAKDLGRQMRQLPAFRDRVDAPGWRDLVALASELDGFPRGLGQHPGGMILSSVPIIDLVPVQQGAIEGRFVCQWDRDAIDMAGFVKIDFLALGALSQVQRALDLIEVRHGKRVDLSRIDFEDPYVYQMLHQGDTIGVFQIESAAQLQTITRIKPQNLTDMAHEVAAVRPGVGATDGVAHYIARRQGREPVTFDHPLERSVLEETLGIILFQDQVNLLAMRVAGFSSAEADTFRRAFTKKNNGDIIARYWQRFRDGAAAKGVSEEQAKRIFIKFNGQYMFPQGHAYAFGVTAYQCAWLKRYYPLEFYVGLFNEQPMGFYSLDSLKEDAKRHDIAVLHPDVNRSSVLCTPEDEAIRLGLTRITGIGEALAQSVVAARSERPFASVHDFLQRTGLPLSLLEQLVDAGALDGFGTDRRRLLQEVALRHHGPGPQLALPFPIDHDYLDVPQRSPYADVVGEYHTMGLCPTAHLMHYLRKYLNEDIADSEMVRAFPEDAVVTTAGVVIRRQHPAANAIFLTLEDEKGQIPLIVWLGVYERYKAMLKQSVIVITGRVSRREGTFNIVVDSARALGRISYAPKAKDWR